VKTSKPLLVPKLQMGKGWGQKSLGFLAAKVEGVVIKILNTGTPRSLEDTFGENRALGLMDKWD